MTQQEIDALSKSLRSQGLTWSQTNFAVSLIRNAVTAGREECARECEDEADRIASARTVASLPGMIDSADELASKSTEAGFRLAARILRSNAIGQGSAACGASPAPTGCATRGEE